MKTSNYKTYNELPLFLNAESISQVLSISESSAYELMHEPDFPVLRVGKRLVVPKDSFCQWVKLSVRHADSSVPVSEVSPQVAQFRAAVRAG